MGAGIHNLLWWALVILIGLCAKGIAGTWWAYFAVIVPAFIWYAAVQFGGDRRS